MFDKVKAIFEEQLGVSQDEMQLDTNFKDDLGVCLLYTSRCV